MMKQKTFCQLKRKNKKLFFFALIFFFFSCQEMMTETKVGYKIFFWLAGIDEVGETTPRVIKIDNPTTSSNSPIFQLKHATPNENQLQFLKQRCKVSLGSDYFEDFEFWRIYTGVWGDEHFDEFVNKSVQEDDANVAQIFPWIQGKLND
jgi:hypothetical protein